MKRVAAAMVVLLALPGGPVRAGAVESLRAIEHAALAEVHAVAPAGARVEAAALPLDRRLRLAACGSDLTSAMPGGRIRGSRVSVAVRCAGPSPWTVRVAVKVQMFRRVLVTTRALARGDHLGAPDVVAKERDVTLLGYGHVDALSQVQGRAMARPVQAGTVLTPSMLAHREVVHRGDRVALLASIGSVNVRATATALGGGDGGQRVQVRNVSSGQVVDATVVGPGVVRALP